MANANFSATPKLVPGDKYCVHITNLSPHTSGGNLGNLFGVSIENVLIDSINREAWITNTSMKGTAESLANKHNNALIDGQYIECRAEREIIHIAILCEYNRIGKCTFGPSCGQKHVLCRNADTCSRNDCYYGHSRKRQLIEVLPINRRGNTRSTAWHIFSCRRVFLSNTIFIIVLDHCSIVKPYVEKSEIFRDFLKNNRYQFCKDIRATRRESRHYKIYE